MCFKSTMISKMSTTSLNLSGIQIWSAELSCTAEVKLLGLPAWIWRNQLARQHTFSLHSINCFVVLFSRSWRPLKSKLGQQGWYNDESARVPSMWPGFDSGPMPYMWVDFVVVSRFAPGVFLRFCSLHKKPTTRNSNSTRIEDLYENQLRLKWLPL